MRASDYYEARANNPRLNTIHKLADFFGVSTDYFLVEDHPDAAKTELQQRVDRVAKLSEGKQEEAGKFLDQLLEDEDTDD